MNERRCHACGKAAGASYWSASARTGGKRHVRVVVCGYDGVHLCRACLLATVRPLALAALRRACSRRQREAIEKRGQLRLPPPVAKGRL